jgi:glutamyl-tRNA(Gln) amidotransferase subunit D
MPKAGDKVLIVTKKHKEEGFLIPSPDKKTTLIKLSTGYNMGFYTKDITKITILEKSKALTVTKQKIKQNKSLPTIAILHTGGTIASKVDYRTGGVTSDFTPEQLISLFPELKDIANIKSELISQMWSDDLRFKHFSIIAETIKKHAKHNHKGIIVGIGTDNLAVAAAALSFIVEEANIPIILVGAQRSSDRGSSDAGMNLICAAEFISQTDFAGVAICMHATAQDDQCIILPATKTYKLHSSRRDAFRPINTEAIATIDYKTKKIKYQYNNYPRAGKKLTIKPKLEEKVGLLKIHVNMFPEQFSLYKGYKGLILEGTGLGHTPGQTPNPESLIHKKIYPAIQALTKSGCIVVMTTQCIYGGVNMNVYDKGRDLQQIGVISGQDMLANTAFVKLSWLLANYPKKTKGLMQQDLRGEINEQLHFDEKFVEW